MRIQMIILLVGLCGGCTSVAQRVHRYPGDHPRRPVLDDPIDPLPSSEPSWLRAKCSSGTVRVQGSIDISMGGGVTQVEMITGSGVLIKDGFVLTALHVITAHGVYKSGRSREIYCEITGDISQHPAEVIAIDPSLDLALLKVSQMEGSRGVQLPLRIDRTQEGENILILGTPARYPVTFTISPGVVLSADQVTCDGYPEMITSDAVPFKGMSGGPAIDMRGLVSGILVSMIRESPEQAWKACIIPIEYAIETFKEHLAPSRQ